MDESKVYSVITTINPPNDCVRRLNDRFRSIDAQIVVIGDRKGPEQYDLSNVDFYSFNRQSSLEFRLASALPENHYARKNLGYLVAISAKADCIYETDDDTMPAEGWTIRTSHVDAEVAEQRPWMNILRNYYDGNIWPRGFPLDQIQNPDSWKHESGGPWQRLFAPIQQGMIDRSPDVDAIWRLVFGKEVYFQNGPSLSLPPGTWCPFNSQNTWWWPEVYSLMYLPSYCELRSTDIWRGLIAQRCLWELGCGLLFHGPDSIQCRNVHNIMMDFKDEVRGYLQNQNIADWLGELKLRSGISSVAENLLRCYESLVTKKLFPADELELVSHWVKDIRDNCRTNAA